MTESRITFLVRNSDLSADAATSTPSGLMASNSLTNAVRSPSGPSAASPPDTISNQAATVRAAAARTASSRSPSPSRTTFSLCARVSWRGCSNLLEDWYLRLFGLLAWAPMDRMVEKRSLRTTGSTSRLRVKTVGTVRGVSGTCSRAQRRTSLWIRDQTSQ